MNDPAEHSEVEQPDSTESVARILADNFANERKPVAIIGGETEARRSSLEDASLRLSTGALTKTIDYPARDMTVTVEAGKLVTELQAVLLSEKQQLPIDMPVVDGATVGGLVAVNPSGPRRFGYGTLRDYLIGLTAVDARGRVFHAGGRVVKNVAGYDLCKLLVGSQGTLAVATELTFKLRPIPEATALLWSTFSAIGPADRVLERLTTSAARPISLDLLNAAAAKSIVSECDIDLPCDDTVLLIGVEGRAADVASQLEVLEEELSSFEPNATKIVRHDRVPGVYQAIAQSSLRTDAPVVLTASVVPSGVSELFRKANDLDGRVACHAGNGIAYIHLPCDVEASDADETICGLRPITHKFQGQLVVIDCDDEWRQRIDSSESGRSDQNLMAAIKHKLDPLNLLNRDRQTSVLNAATSR